MMGAFLIYMACGVPLVCVGWWAIASGLQVGWYSRPRVTPRELFSYESQRAEVLWQAKAVRADLDQATRDLHAQRFAVEQAMGTLPAGEYELHVQEQPTPVMVTWTPYDQAREAFVRSGSPSAKEAMLSHVRLPYDPNCTYPGCGGSGTVWDGEKLVKCPQCGLW